MWSRNHPLRLQSGLHRKFVLASAAALALVLPAAALLPSWLQHTVAGTALEGALFRAMSLPGVSVLFPRPPAESVGELNILLSAAPSNEHLLLLRSRQEEAALDLTAAERDLKACVSQVPNDRNARLQLADFYHRRLAVNAEFATLLDLGSMPPSSDDAFQPPLTQTSWRAFERALRVATDQSLPAASFDTLWQHWISRYPQQATIYARAFTWNLNQHREAAAQAILDRYKQAFPADAVFPVKASALLTLASGGPNAQSRALAYYDSAFQPLWPKELLDSYFDLLAATHQTRRFVADAQTRLQNDPDDIDAVARLFLYYRHQNHPDTAAALLDTFRQSKEQLSPTGKNWSPDDLYTLAQLCASAQLYAEAARYNFALYHVPGKLRNGRTAQQAGLTGMISILLTAPDQPIALGSSNLGMYRDIGTLDQGPGFWNGILSLWLNSQSISSEFADQETKAQPYFHRSKAAALLQLLDQQESSAPERPALHAQLIDVYADYGEDTALLHEGDQFLRNFPNAPQRTAVALAMADADARAKNTTAEFALYDRLLEELGRATNNMPLSSAVASTPVPEPGPGTPIAADSTTSDDDSDSGQEPAAPSSARAFDLDTGDPTLAPNLNATAYAQVLDRYLGRLTATNHLPQALAVLRKELDRNPNDPKLYERLADFLSQNDLSAQQEQVYRAAIAKFGGTSWYDKLARLYLREKRQEDFAALTKQVTDIFSGTDLEAYFAEVRGGGPQLFLELNLYAHRRFPHDLTFTNNLLRAYSTRPTADHPAWEHLLRESWWQSPELTTQFFAWLSQTGQLNHEIAELESQTNPNTTSALINTASLTELAQANLWQSHFERSNPLFNRLAELYPADQSVGTTAADLNRSLAWLDPSGPDADIIKAVSIEQHLLAADAADQDRLIRIGDILSDHADGTRVSYAPAAAYWRRVPASEPGNPDNYLSAATVFWDYFQFDDALDQIDLARTHFHQPALFGYEAGAILEGKRDFTGAVHEYVGAALANPANVTNPSEDDKRPALSLNSIPDLTSEITDDPAADRLLQLARRPSTAALVDSATAAALNANMTLPALRLRLAVLDSQHRNSEDHPLLIAAIAHAGTADAAASLGAFAQKQRDTSAYEAALEREANLTPDPVEKLQLTYDLVRSYEARNDLPDAIQLVDKTYKANPRLLGVVRFTVDFDWSNKRQKEAINTLLEAAHVAQPALAQSFNAEAASRANESGDWNLGRSLATALLLSDPYNPQFVSIAAESYTRAGDISGLEGFYRARIDAIRTASMTSDQRKTRIAQLRRGLIPALITDKNYPAALDQYISLITAFPEDNSLVREAALFALRYGQQDQLRSFYLKTTQASPRDARFYVDLAQTQDIFGNPTYALTAYTHAVALRPERSDLFIAKAALEERLQRFDAAVADYTRLFQLSYKDPQWMIAAAQAEARQGHTTATVQALETAYLHGAQTTPHDLFTIAAQLAQWNMLPEAVTFAQRGAKLAGPDLLAGQPPSILPDDANIYARILTRTRQTAEVFTTLGAALAGVDESPSSPSTIAAQVRTSGLGSVTDTEWRRQYVHARQQRAQGQYTQAILAMSEIIGTYGTPEDRAAYITTLSTHEATATSSEISNRWIPAAHAANLGELEARWRARLLNSNTPRVASQLQPYIDLQQARLRFAELGAELEQFVRTHPRDPGGPETIRQAANAYAAAGQTQAELHLLSSQRLTNPDNSSLRDIYLDLLAQHDPDALIALAGSQNEILADAAASAALAAAPSPTALSAIHARGTSEPPVWTAAYTGLAGLYLDVRSASIDTAFRDALTPDATIGERLSSHPDTDRQLTGDRWFYEAGRYGQWRLLSAAPDADDVLPADLEQAPVFTNFLTLAQTESEGGLTGQALADTAHALEISPGSVDALDMRAELLWSDDHKPDAIDCWRSSLAALRAGEEKGPAPESFWTGFQRIALRVKQHQLFAQLRPAMDDLLRSYLTRNGTYRSNELLQAALQSAPDETTGVSWLLTVIGAAPDPAQVLQELASDPSLSTSAQEQILSRALDLLQAHTGATGIQDYRVAQIRATLLRLYIQNHQDSQALALIQASPKDVRSTPEFQRAALVAAARSGNLPTLLKTYDEAGATTPTPDVIRSAAATLASSNDWNGARSLLEWNFTRAESEHTLTATDYLTLAESRLHTNDISAAIGILHSLVTTSQNRYTDEDAAATLLETSHLQPAAIPFLKELALAVPWDLSYRVRLSEAQIAAARDLPSATQDLTFVAKNGFAPYALRARAARDLTSTHTHAPALGSAELNLLASGAPSPSLARQPLFVEARLAAAAQTQNPDLRIELLREAIAISPYSPDANKLRFQLFQLTAEANQTPLARASLDHMLAAQSAYTWPPPPRPARSGLLQYLDLNNTGEDYASSSFESPLPLYAQLLPASEQAIVAEQIARVYRATNNLTSARTYLVLAKKLLSDDDTNKARIAGQLASLDAQIRLAAANTARRPVIRKQLDQPVIVRVRLKTLPGDLILPDTTEQQ